MPQIDKHPLFETINKIELKKPLKVIETFAGAGGLALGLEQAGFETIMTIEKDKHASATLEHNRPEWDVRHEDIYNMLDIQLPEFDILSGGYPCQAFSYAGKREGMADTRGTLFHPYSELIKKYKPKAFIAENVKGLVTHDKGRSFETMLDTFSKLGYVVYWDVFNSWDYGVAQKRERLIMVGIRDDIVQTQVTPFVFPSPFENKPVLRDVLKDVPSSLGISYSERKRTVMEMVPPGGCWVDLPPAVAEGYMGKAYFSGGGRRGMARRLSWDEPCLTLTTSPSQKQTERCHPDETRPLTVREYARIQGFPDEWEFQGGVTAQYKQIGNAVPVPLAKIIGQAVIAYFSQFE